MKRMHLFRRILAGALILGMTVLDVMPAMASDVQKPEKVIEAEETEMPADKEMLEVPAVIDETSKAQQEESMDEPQTAVKKETSTIQEENAAQQEKEVLQEDGEQQEGEIEGEDEEITQTVPVMNTAAIQKKEYSSYALLTISYTGTDIDYAKVSVKASNNSKIVYTNNYFFSGDSIDTDNFSASVASGATYTFTLTPFSYEGVAGAPKSVTWKAPVVAKISKLAVNEISASGFEFSCSTTNKNVNYQYSKSKKFNSKIADIEEMYGDTLYYSYLKSGVTYYVRAYASRCGVKKYSNVISVKAPAAEVTGISTEISNTSVTLTINTAYGKCDGFQISRRKGKGKYKTLITTTDSRYKDTGLKKNSKYTYRVRAYCFNTATRKTTYGAYAYQTVQTGAAAMNLKAKASGKNSIKLTWKKVSGAAGYEVYRCVGQSVSNTYKPGESGSFTKYELVKSLGRKSSSYTDKKLVAGESYSYLVKAYKLVKKKKVYFTQSGASAGTKFGLSTRIDIYKTTQNPKNGKVRIEWYPIPQAKGYLIERYNDAKGSWVTKKRITKAKTTSYTLPAAAIGKSVRYRVRAYSGKKYSDEDTVIVTGHLPVVTGVKAQSTSRGIKISWKKVKGASYYEVYRTSSSAKTYYADTKTYYYPGGSNVTAMAFKKTANKDNYYTLGGSTAKMEHDYAAAQKLMYEGIADRIKGTSIVDYSYSYHSSYSKNVEQGGPQSDVTYYYYVIAYKDIKNGSNAGSYGNSKAASAAMAGKAAVKKPSSVKVKAGVRSATISYKKVKNAKKYYIYRSDSKKGAFKLVGTTTKTKFKDKKLTSKKTYRYKVRAYSKNSLGADRYSAFSKVKSVKVK